MLKRLEILGGADRHGRPEEIGSLILHPGESLTVAGPTGSGKSELLADIEQFAEGDTPSGRIVRFIALEDEPPQRGARLVATLSQRTHFTVDATIERFIETHAASIGKSAGPGRDSWPGRVLALANTLCGEPMAPGSLLQRLSGGQTRALMIADIAVVSDAPIVLIDEVENAGIDKHLALSILAGHGKIAIIATHDSVLMLAAQRRLIMGEGGMRRLLELDDSERACHDQLRQLDETLLRARDALRRGQRLTQEIFS